MILFDIFTRNHIRNGSWSIWKHNSIHTFENLQNHPKKNTGTIKMTKEQIIKN
jgi:hypothetical protein